MTTANDPAGGASGDLVAASDRLGAALRGGDRAALEDLLAGDFTFIDASGKTHSRSEALAALAAGHGSAAARKTVADYGSVALVTGRSRGAGQSEDVAVEAWVKESGAWRILVYHLNAIACSDAPSTHQAPTPRAAEAPPAECRNPCAFVPYEAASEGERGIVASFQALEAAVIRGLADDWVPHVADEFVVFRTSQHPTDKAGRAQMLRNQRAVNAETFVAAVEWMKLWVHGDAAVMRADHVMPGNRRPPYRATRVWVKRDGRWQMASSQQTTRAA